MVKSKNNVMSIVVSFLTIIITLSGCSGNKIYNWDLEMLAYTEKMSDYANCEIGIIDMDYIIYSDDNTCSNSHMVLVETAIKKLLPEAKLVYKLIELDSGRSNLESAIISLIENGIKIINISLGTKQTIVFSDKLKCLIKDNDVAIICSGGNNNQDLLYPANCPEAISVVACDINGNTIKNYSKCSKKSYVVPGYHIELGYNTFSGSSISSAYFTAIYAACKTKHSNYSRDQVLRLINKKCIYASKYYYGIPQIEKLF